MKKKSVECHRMARLHITWTVLPKNRYTQKSSSHCLNGHMKSTLFHNETQHRWRCCHHFNIWYKWQCPLPAVGDQSNNRRVTWHPPTVSWISCLFGYSSVLPCKPTAHYQLCTMANCQHVLTDNTGWRGCLFVILKHLNRKVVCETVENMGFDRPCWGRNNKP